MKNTCNIDSAFKFDCNVYLSPLTFFSIRWPIPLIFKKHILIPNFIFFIFIFMEWKREVAGFKQREKNLYWWQFRSPNKFKLVSTSSIRWCKFYVVVLSFNIAYKTRSGSRMQYFFLLDLVVWTVLWV